MAPSRVARYAGLVVGGIALVYALVPFSVAGSDALLMQQTASCGPSVVEATRTPPKESGWFGYAPLTGTSARFDQRPCFEPARHRLMLSSIGLLAAALLGWVAARIDRSGGAARRYRWRPHPA